MTCRVCEEDYTHPTCSKCGQRKPRDEMARKPGTNKVLDTCKDCKALKTETYCCSDCGKDVTKKELYLDGKNLQWQSNDGNRERIHFWCLACAFPTCNCCHIKTRSAIKRDASEFVCISTMEWYHYDFLNSKKLCPTRRQTKRFIRDKIHRVKLGGLRLCMFSKETSI